MAPAARAPLDALLSEEAALQAEYARVKQEMARVYPRVMAQNASATPGAAAVGDAAAAVSSTGADEVVTAGEDARGSGGSGAEARALKFVGDAEVLLRGLHSECGAVRKAFKQLLRYFGEDPGTPSDTFFATLSEFIKVRADRRAVAGGVLVGAGCGRAGLALPASVSRAAAARCRFRLR